MQNKRNWLIISHDFNMDGRAPSLTVTDKIPYLLKADLSLTVISAVTGNKDVRFTHFQILPWGPSALRFDFRHWFKTKFGKGLSYKLATGAVSLITLPFSFLERILVGFTSQWSWSFPAAFRAYRLIKKNKIELIYSSGGDWSAHYAAYLVKKWTGVTWIAEIHDPLIENKPGKISRDEKFKVSLEAKIANHADLAWWFTNNALQEATQRYARLKQIGFVVRPGAEPPGCHQPLPLNHQYASDALNILHFGSLATDRSFAPLLDALSIFFKKHPEYKNSIKLHVYGTSLDSASKEAMERNALEKIMILHGRIEADKTTGKSGREVIMDTMRSADVLLLLHGNRPACHEYVPSKLYDYSWTNRPVFALTHLSDELDDLLKTRNAYIAHTIDQASILKALSDLMHDWKNNQLRQQPFTPLSPNTAVQEILMRTSSL